MPSQGGGGKTGPRESQKKVKAEIEELKNILMKKRTLYGHDRVKYEDKDVEGMLEPLAPGERLDVLRTYRDELQQRLMKFMTWNKDDSKRHQIKQILLLQSMLRKVEEVWLIILPIRHLRLKRNSGNRCTIDCKT